MFMTVLHACMPAYYMPDLRCHGVSDNYKTPLNIGLWNNIKYLRVLSSDYLSFYKNNIFRSWFHLLVGSLVFYFLFLRF